MNVCLSAGKVRESSFNHRGLPAKLVQTCLSVSNDVESCLYHCEGAE